MAWLAMYRTGCSATLEKIGICVCMSCASLIRTRYSNIDILKLAGRRPTIKRPYCTAIVIKSRLVCRCVSLLVQCLMFHSPDKYFVLLPVCSMSLEQHHAQDSSLQSPVVRRSHLTRKALKSRLRQPMPDLVRTKLFRRPLFCRRFSKHSPRRHVKGVLL